MSQSIGADELIRMLRGAAAQVRANHEALSKLDTFGGDGDHGTTMLRAMANVEKAIGDSATRSLQGLLHGIGWAIMGVDGGATGPLLGTFFIGMSEAVAGKDALDAKGLAEMFRAGLAAVRKQTRAKPGDKTMIDALAPAVEAMSSVAEGGGNVSDVLLRAAEEAQRGAAATRDMQARFGRAKNLGPRSVGNPDAGATSISLVFRGFQEGVNSHG
jgi:dihydroxyacetone kinase-like protein